MTNKVMVEIDLDMILTARDKTDALYKALKDEVFSRHSALEEMRKKILSDLIDEQAYQLLKDKVSAELQSLHSSPVVIKKIIEGRQYDIGNIVSGILKEHKDLFEREILRYMAKGEFQKKIAELVERNLTARVECLIMPSRNNDDD